MLQHSWTSARAPHRGRSAAACQCHPAADFAMPRETSTWTWPGKSQSFLHVILQAFETESNIPHCQGWRSPIHHLSFLFTSEKPTLSSYPKQVCGVCACEDFSPRRRKGPLPPPSSLHHIDPEFQSICQRPRLWTFPGGQSPDRKSVV